MRISKEFLLLADDADRVEDPIELPCGTAAFLFLKGVRQRQNDALWAAVLEDQLVLCAADGAGDHERSGEMAKWVVEFAANSAKKQMDIYGSVTPLNMQRGIVDGINHRNSCHKGYSTALCAVIDGRQVSLNRVGDPDTRLNSMVYPHPNLFPENKGFAEFLRKHRGIQITNINAFDEEAAAGLARGQALLHADDRNRRLLHNVHTGYDTDVSEASLTIPDVRLMLKPGDRFTGGSDGLEHLRLDSWHRATLEGSLLPAEYLIKLWTKLENVGGENASGFAFFCER